MLLRRSVRLLLVVALAVGVAACSDDGDDGAAESITSTVPTTVDGTTGGPTATTGGVTTSEPEGELVPEPGETVFEGSVSGAADEAAVSFARSDRALRAFSVRGLAVTCNPLEGLADPETRTIDVVIDEVPLAADGTVFFNGTDGYHPQLEGAFSGDRFSGGLLVAYDDGGLRCAGEFGFLAGG